MIPSHLLMSAECMFSFTSGRPEGTSIKSNTYRIVLHSLEEEEMDVFCWYTKLANQHTDYAISSEEL
jgi:hypothetical protein